MDFKLIIFLVLIIGVAVVLVINRIWQKKDEKKSTPEYKKQLCEKEGHSWSVPLRGDELGLATEFIQIDRRGYQKEVCSRCSAQFVSDKRLAEIDALEFQSEYSTDMNCILDDKVVKIGNYTIEIEPEESTYLFMSKNVSEDLRYGDIYACMKIKGDGLCGEEHIEKNAAFPPVGELTRTMVAEDENGDPVAAAPIECLAKETFDALSSYEQKALLEDFRSGFKPCPCNYIAIRYPKGGAKRFRPFVHVDLRRDEQ